MKKSLPILTLLLVLLTIQACNTKNILPFKERNKRVLYFNPEIYPDIKEIKAPTYISFFSSVSNEISSIQNRNFLRADSFIPYDEVDSKIIKDFCYNNDADYAVIPRVKYFKVGLGQYVFSNQVEVSLKLYNAKGELLGESKYNTYKRNMRLLGNAENFIKIGTYGAIKDLRKQLRKLQTLDS